MSEATIEALESEAYEAPGGTKPTARPATKEKADR